MNITPGEYRTRGGRRARVIGDSFHGWVDFDGARFVGHWGPDGRSSMVSSQPDALDLIAPWTDEEPVKTERRWVRVYCNWSSAAFGFDPGTPEFPREVLDTFCYERVLPDGEWRRVDE